MSFYPCYGAHDDGHHHHQCFWTTAGHVEDDQPVGSLHHSSQDWRTATTHRAHIWHQHGRSMSQRRRRPPSPVRMPAFWAHPVDPGTYSCRPCPTCSVEERLHWEPPLQGRQPARVVEVILPDSVYICYLDDLEKHLPHARYFGLDKGSPVLFPLESLLHEAGAGGEYGGYMAAMVAGALHNMFRAFERVRGAGTTVDLFDKASALLTYGSNGRGCFRTSFDLFVGTCAALDSEKGLGCSEELLRQLGTFALQLRASPHPASRQHGTAWPIGTVEALFASYSKVFRAGAPGHSMETLRSLWESLELELKGRLMREMAVEMRCHPCHSNVHTMYRALHDMGLA